MADALRKKNQVILAKLETAYDTDPTPSASTDALLAINPLIKEIATPARRQAQIASLSRLPSVTGEKWAEVTFSIENKGSGVVGTAPRIGPLWQACSFSETIISNTSVTYKPTSTNQKSITLYVYIDGRRHIVTGAVGDVKRTSDSADFDTLEFSFMGRYAAPTNVALPSVTLESTQPQVCKSANFQYNSKNTLVLKSVITEMNNKVVPRPDINDENDIKGFIITDRDPMVTIDPEMTIETSYTFRDDAFTTQRELSYVVGATAGNIITTTIPKFNPYNPEYSDRDEIMVETIKGEAAQDSGNDEVQIVYT